MNMAPVHSGRNDFAARQVIERLPAANQTGRAVLNEDFGRQRLAVVIARHHEAVSAGPLNHHIIADSSRGERSLANEAAFLLREDIARFAEGAPNDDVL